jgi:hypothetical protein
MRRVMGRPPVSSRQQREVERADRRWFLAAAAVFTLSLGLFFGAHHVYRATGPHPQMTAFVRRLKGLAHRFLPRWRRLKADR